MIVTLTDILNSVCDKGVYRNDYEICIHPVTLRRLIVDNYTAFSLDNLLLHGTSKIDVEDVFSNLRTMYGLQVRRDETMTLETFELVEVMS